MSAVPKLLSISEAAESLNISQRHLREEIRQRKLAHVRLGRRVLVSEADLQKYLASRTVVAVDPKSIAREMLS